MPKKKGHKSPNSRDENLGMVRLTKSEKNAIKTNAQKASLSVAGFVRARTIPPMMDNEKLVDPKPGQSRRLNRSPLTRALQRILLLLQQIDQYIDTVGSDKIFEDFTRVRQALRDLQTDHLDASNARTKLRMSYVEDLNQHGRSLNRIVRVSHEAGEIKDPQKLEDFLTLIDQTVLEIGLAGEGVD